MYKAQLFYWYCVDNNQFDKPKCGKQLIRLWQWSQKLKWANFVKLFKSITTIDWRLILPNTSLSQIFNKINVYKSICIYPLSQENQLSLSLSLSQWATQIKKPSWAPRNLKSSLTRWSIWTYYQTIHEKFLNSLVHNSMSFYCINDMYVWPTAWVLLGNKKLGKMYTARFF